MRRASTERIARLTPLPVDDLVLENTDKPGSQRRLRSERSLPLQGGHERVLHDFVGYFRSAQFREGVAVEVGTVQRDRLGLCMNQTCHCHSPLWTDPGAKAGRPAAHLEATHSPSACPQSRREFSRKSHVGFNCF